MFARRNARKTKTKLLCDVGCLWWAPQYQPILRSNHSPHQKQHPGWTSRTGGTQDLWLTFGLDLGFVSQNRAPWWCHFMHKTTTQHQPQDKAVGVKGNDKTHAKSPYRCLRVNGPTASQGVWSRCLSISGITPSEPQMRTTLLGITIHGLCHGPFPRRTNDQARTEIRFSPFYVVVMRAR